MDIIIMRSIKRNSVLIVLIFFLLYTVDGFREANTNPSDEVYVRDSEINKSNFEDLGHSYIVKFLNVLEDSAKPAVRVPIYGGVKGNVKLSQLNKKRKKNVSILGSIIIETGKGKAKQGIISCLKFYKNSLLKNTDITKPTKAGADKSGLIIWYDFDYEGLPGTIMIGVARDENCLKGRFKCGYTNINDIEVDDRADGFRLSIGIDEKSRWRRVKESVKGER